MANSPSRLLEARAVQINVHRDVKRIDRIHKMVIVTALKRSRALVVLLGTGNDFSSRRGAVPCNSCSSKVVVHISTAEL